MKDHNQKLKRYLDNLNENGLKQLLTFILQFQSKSDRSDAIKYSLLQVEDHACMYPEFDRDMIES